MPAPTYLGCFNHHQDLTITGQSAVVGDEIEVIYRLNDYDVSKKFIAEAALSYSYLKHICFIYSTINETDAICATLMSILLFES